MNRSDRPGAGVRARDSMRCGAVWGRRAAVLAFLVVAVVVPPGVAGGAATAADALLRFGIASAPDNLDPRFATDAASTRVNRLLYDRLVDFDDAFRPVPALARWERLSPRHYRFHLRADRRTFHDGTPLRAVDVVATYESVLDRATGSPHRGSLHMVDAVHAVDDERIDFQLSADDLLFPGRLVVGILPATRLEAAHPFNEAPIGSGPFRYVDRPAPEVVLIERLGDGARVEISRIQKADVRILKLLRGELDATQGDMPPELLGWLGGRDEVVVRRQEGTTFAYLGFNLQDPAVGDLRVRRAVAHAVNRDAIIEHLWARHARPAAAILAPDHWAGHPRLAGVAHDPARARALLREAGYGDGRRLRLTYKTSTNPVRVRIATVLQHQLAQVGIDLDIRTYDWGTFYGDIKAGNFQLYTLAWVGIKMPDIFRYVFHSAAVPPAGANRGRWLDDTVDALIERAEAGKTFEDQARHYREVQEHALAQLPYVPLWYEDQVLAARPHLRGYTLSRDGNFDGLIEARWDVDGARR